MASLESRIDVTYRFPHTRDAVNVAEESVFKEAQQLAENEIISSPLINLRAQDEPCLRAQSGQSRADLLGCAIAA